MDRFIQFFLLVLSLLFFSSCEEGGDQKLDDPSNLIVEITISEENSELVDVVATANNATQFYFYHGETIGGEPEINETGVFSHEYLSAGVFNIEIRAYGQSGRFLTKSQQVTITSDGGPIDGADGYITPLTYVGMNLVWQDEFSGSGLNAADWTFETGGGGWGNNELEYYREQNTTVSDGYLTIEARKESFGGKNYTSSRIKTAGKQEFTYGRIDIRALLPMGQGIWPALWMLGGNIGTVGWPKCGEIDIMEMIGGTNRDNEVHGTAHWDNNGNYASYGKGKKLATGIFNDKFHVFTIIWDESKIAWYMDDVQFNVIDITPAELSEFHAKQFLLMNLAVGGNWPGSPNASTVFPQKMVVDYVRVFQKK